MAIIHQPESLQALRRRAPILALILVVALMAPLEWFPRFQGRYELGVGLFLIVIGMDAISSTLGLLGLITTVRSLGGQSATKQRLLAAFITSVAFLSITVPFLSFAGTPLFSWIATALLLPLILCSIANRMLGRRLLRSIEHA